MNKKTGFYTKLNKIGIILGIFTTTAGIITKNDLIFILGILGTVINIIMSQWRTDL